MLARADDRYAERVTAWLAARGVEPFEYQREAWAAIRAGHSGLIVAPTGTGKTLAAWLGVLLRDAATALDMGHGERAQGPRALWITPLRALANDLVVQLRAPLPAFDGELRVELRTGDTGAQARRRQRERPPAALVTTPESLSVLLSYADTHAQLSAVRYVIVDEWHELLGTKRGVQLELCLAHLRGLNPGLMQWGLSATLPNLEEALAVLLGPSRSGRLIRADIERRLELESLLPDDVERFPWAGHLGLRLLPRVVDAIDRAGTTLVFTNTRSQAEIWHRSLIEARPDWRGQLELHHGSIDRRLRESIERGLSAGVLRCVVCTSSLDLGVDFAPVDQVIQVGSPKGIGRLLQRAGRSGHRPGATSRMVCVPTNAWEIVEIAAVRQALAERRLEARRPLSRCLDVLVQHAVTLAAGPGTSEEALLAEARDTHAFARLGDSEWRWVLDFITRGGSALQGYPQFRRVVRFGGRLRTAEDSIARRHRMSIGTISSDTEMLVKWLRGGALGTIEESFVGRMRPGASFVFAGRVLELVRVRDMTAYVRASKSTRRHVPQWQGGRMPLSTELAESVLRVLEAGRRREYRWPELRHARALLELQARWSMLPSPAELLVERLSSREGWHLYVFPFAGRAANEGLATLVASRWARAAPRTFAISANDYGFELLAQEPLPDDEASLRAVLSLENLAADLLESVNLSELARRQFRDIARIAGLVFQGFPGRGKSTRQLQASSSLVYEVLERYDAENLLLEQARAEVLDAQLEVRRLREALERIAAQRIEVREVRRRTPLAFPLWAQRLQSQTLSSESWQSRIERAAHALEAHAAREERS